MGLGIEPGSFGSAASAPVTSHLSSLVSKEPYDEDDCFSRVIFIPVFHSILMMYTVALANCYGRLISELKRQIETVSQADFPGKGSMRL